MPSDDNRSIAAHLATAMKEMGIRYDELVKYPTSHRALGAPDDVPLGVIKIGATRGLTNTLTGDSEHLSRLSGHLAAQAVLAHRDDSDSAHTSYERQLRQYVYGARLSRAELVTRQSTSFKILARTLTDANPYFHAMRQILLLPGGFSSPTPETTGSGSASLPEPLVSYLRACDLIAGSRIARQWPNLIGSAVTEATASAAFRPSALLACSHLLSGGRNIAPMASLGAALDLASIGCLAQAASAGGAVLNVRDTDLHAGTSILVADYCFAWGYRLACQYGSWVSGAFANWMLDIAELRASGTRGYDYYSAAFELPMRLGAQLTHADRQTIDTLGEVGHLLGRVFGASEEVLARQGLPHHLSGGLDGLRAVGLTCDDLTTEKLAGKSRRDCGHVLELLSTFSASPLQATLSHAYRNLTERCGPSPVPEEVR